MDDLNRWAIGLGVGALAGMAVLGAHHTATSSAQTEMMSFAINQLVPEHASLDVTAEFDSYDIEPFSEMAQRLQDADVEREIGCGGYPNPAHVCATTAFIPDGLTLVGGATEVVRDTYALTVGEYQSDFLDILTASHSVMVDTGTGPRPVTYEGNGTFTLGYLGKTHLGGQNEPWQFAVAAIGYAPVWLSAAAVAGIIAVLMTAALRPTHEEAVEQVGVEFFDKLTGETPHE